MHKPYCFADVNKTIRTLHFYRLFTIPTFRDSFCIRFGTTQRILFSRHILFRKFIQHLVAVCDVPLHESQAFIPICWWDLVEQGEPLALFYC